MRDSHDHSDMPRLAHLAELKHFEVAEGYPDIRGWLVISANGVQLGKVHDLIVDTAAMRTKYIDVTLSKHIAGHGDDRDVLIPIGTASLVRKAEQVLINDDVVARVHSLPAYKHGALTDDYEHRVLATLGMAAADSERHTTEYLSEREVHRPIVAADREIPPHHAHPADVHEEHVIESRPVIEEVVVRKRPATEEEVRAFKKK